MEATVVSNTTNPAFTAGLNKGKYLVTLSCGCTMNSHVKLSGTYPCQGHDQDEARDRTISRMAAELFQKVGR